MTLVDGWVALCGISWPFTACVCVCGFRLVGEIGFGLLLRWLVLGFLVCFGVVVY